MECDPAASLLEPMMGLGLAFNLAYLGLPIFGFIELIATRTDKLLQDFTPEATALFQNTEWYKEAKEIAGLVTIGDYRFKWSGTRRWIAFPTRLCSFLFNILFLWRIGKGFSVLATVICAYIVCLGVAQQMKVTAWCGSLDWFGSTPTFLICCVALLWPAGCIASGEFIRMSTESEFKRHFHKLGGTALRENAAVLTQVENALGIPTPPEAPPATSDPPPRRTRTPKSQGS